MDMEVFAQYQACTDPVEKRRLHGRLVKENLPLAVTIVGQMVARRDRTVKANLYDTREGGSSAREDMLQAGLIGLATAIKRFVPGKGKFAPYVKHWIRHELQQCLLHDVPIYRPKAQAVTHRFAAIEQRVFAKEGRAVTAEDLGLKEEDFVAWLEMAHVTKSLDDSWNPFGDSTPDQGGQEGESTGGNLTLETTMASDSRNPEQALDNAQTMAEVREILEGLEGQERAIVHGLFVEDLTVPQLAKRLGMSPGAVETKRDAILVRLRDELEDE